jgi:hypothetical protein
MSITVSDPSSNTASKLGFFQQPAIEVHMATYGSMSEEESASGSIQTISPAERRRPASVSRKNPLRRLQGFLIEMHGEESKVAVEENGELIEYYFPSQLLRKNGLTLKNQPFELDEFLTDSALVFEIRPLARAENATTAAISLDPERRRKMDLLLSEPGDAQA